MDLFDLRLASFYFFLGSLKLSFGYLHSYECGRVVKYNTELKRNYDFYQCNMFCQDENLSTKLDYKYDRNGEQNRYPFNTTINGSNTNTMETDIFEYYPKINILKISNTRISAFLPGAFSKLNELTDLYITHNYYLQLIKSSIFNSMPNLQRLDLSFNNITFIDEHALYNLQKLKYLILSHNRITSVSPSLFTWSKNLTYIDFSHNKFASIEASALDNLPLETLYFQNNFLKNVSSICSHLSQKIQHLDLSHNQIEDCETCLQLKNLKTLKLASTNLSDVDFLNDGFNNLEVLDLSANNIEEIGHTLTQLKELQILNLSFNKIGVLPIGCFSNLTKLQHLNLSHNKIDELQLGVFQDLTNVNNMDLSHNNLQKLHEECFHVMKNLKYLKIDYNNINDIDVHEFASGLSLSQVSLGNNKWKCPTLKTIIKNLEKLHTTITVSSERKRKNIYGILCEDGDDPNTQIVSSGTTTNNTPIKQQLVMPNLDKFDENFKKTAFFEMAKKISTGNIVDVKKFDDNFKNAEFYNFIKGDLMNNNFSAIMKRFDGAFANTLVYKSLQKEFLMKKLEELAEKNVNESELDPRDNDGEEKQFQKYLDDGFRNSTFYKYFEQFSKNPNDGVAEKLVQDEKNGDHTNTLLVFVVLLLTLVLLTLWYEKYQNCIRQKFNVNRNDDTASGILMT